MALPGGTVFARVEDIPPPSRPDREPQPLAGLPGGRGAHHPRRTGPDGTRWCLGCHTTVGAASRAVFCPACARRRRALTAVAARRSRSAERVVVPGAVAQEVRVLAESVQRGADWALVASLARTPLRAEDAQRLAWEARALHTLAGTWLAPARDGEP